MTLPLATPRSSGQPIEPQLTTLRDSPAETTVLVVDDNVDAANALELLLEAHGFRVFVAHDGGVALTRADEVQPQIVLMDLGLPVLDGYQVASALRSRPNGSAGLRPRSQSGARRRGGLRSPSGEADRLHGPARSALEVVAAAHQPREIEPGDRRLDLLLTTP